MAALAIGGASLRQRVDKAARALRLVNAGVRRLSRHRIESGLALLRRSTAISPSARGFAGAAYALNEKREYALALENHEKADALYSPGNDALFILNSAAATIAAARLKDWPRAARWLHRTIELDSEEGLRLLMEPELAPLRPRFEAVFAPPEFA